MIPFCPCGRVGRCGRAKVTTNNMCRDCLAEQFGWVAVLRFERAQRESMLKLLDELYPQSTSDGSGSPS